MKEEVPQVLTILFAFVLPLILMIANSIYSFGGILLTIIIIIWIGLAVMILVPIIT